MNHRFSLVAVGALALAATVGFAQSQQEPRRPTSPPAQEGAPQLPPGWTEQDMQACIAAATPGEQHVFLAESAGVWKGRTTMWMVPGAEPTVSECTATIETILDGRFTTCEMAGEVPDMGPFNGFGLYGYDNVAKTFQSTWVDNWGTTMATGTGERSSDGDTLTWTYTYTCPITKKPTTLREVETITGANTKTLTMYGIDPKSGDEFKMMEIAFTRTSRATADATIDGN